MLPRWCGLLLVCSAVAVAVEDESVGHAMKSILFGSDQPNNNSTQSDSLGYTFHQYLQPNSAARQQPSGQACGLPQQIGTGPYRIPRWYFNPARGRCELFYWSGCCGNGNNFQTFQSCQSVCEVSSVSKIVSFPTSSSSFSSLPTIINPSSGSRLLPACSCCLRPFSVGYGNLFLPRFYYDISSRTCRPFIYRGNGGFGNSFETEQNCQTRCTGSVNVGGTTIILTVPSTIDLTQQEKKPQEIVYPVTALPPSSTTATPLQISTTTMAYAFPVDPCTQNKEQGVGAIQMTRYYFNKETKICESFIYFGSGGNRNNFQDLAECQAQCPESPNPCAVATSGPLNQCSPGVNSCGVGYYCHIGAATQTTVCCPKPAAVDKCQQPLNIGVGNANIQRWYFNPLTQQCQSCVYKGLQGNENNFLSKQECENSCLVNPCRVGTPYRSQGVTVQCSASNAGVCPGGYYCHIGADIQTSVCCQAIGISPCEETMTKGEGNSALTRFYYDAKQRKCFAFNYFGSKGNTNNFLTKESCETTCPVWVNPCAVGQPLLTIDQRPFQCHQGAPCTNGYYCHLGYDEATTVCCQSEGDPCTLIVKEGYGTQSIGRWFYNQQTRQCQPFSYKGQGGNENNFLLREHCEATCPVWVNACPSGEPYLLPSGRPQTCDSNNQDSCPMTHWCHPGPDQATTMCCPGRTDPCMNAVSEGEGPLQLMRYYFNAATRQCDEFSFRGLKGNANNFLSLEECERRCPIQMNPCPITFSSIRHTVKLMTCSATQGCPDKHWCHLGETKETTVCCPNAPPDPCMAPPRNPGQGEAHATRWAFDGTARKCVPFEYRGLKGNSNNFLTRESCEKRCPVFENPCKVGEAYSANNQYYQCSPQSVCPGGYYCHVGKDANYCCQALGGDPCGQPMDRGQGGYQIARWYWNQQQQCCLPFSYCGQKGTQNNFLNKDDCEKTCYELDNPCALGEPQMIPQTNRPIQCSIQSNTCSGDFWCHFGANAQTTVCCPHREEGEAICRQAMVQGTGDAQLPRWYFDLQNRRCVQFMYRGREGNQNNFLSKEQCEQQCPAYVNVCPSGTPLLDSSSNKPVPCTFGSNSCGSGHWCHLGLVPDEYQCCPGEPVQPGACSGLPMVDGQLGAAAPPATRYYYDVTGRTCEQFIYNGRQGNQNNFLTLEDCEATCDVFVNPCNQPISMPAQSCSVNNPNVCGPSSWCHIGASAETTICCPSEGDPCSLPMSRGTGQQFVDRWYFNQQTGTCQSFTYAGLQGNQNNFLSRESCEERCGPNPCFEGRPFAGVDGRAQTCSVSANLNTCPANYWCHIGADSSTTVCCQGASTNVCNLPMSTGEGNSRLDRYYYDQSSRTCRPFVYNGLKGNQNNFVSLRSCQLACQPLDNPCIGQPATTAAGQVLFCSSTNKDACPVNFWCHLGATPETTVCCPGATNPCSVPLAPGTGNSGLGRWYYNPDDRQCLPFQYNGKRGNQNNFETQADCERTCPVFHNPCIGQVAHNSTGDAITCNPLNQKDTCPNGYHCLAGDLAKPSSSVCCACLNQDVCQTFMTEGEGSANFTRYYYNPIESDCLPFGYRGSKGNENNFLTQEKCRERCKPVANVCFGGESPLLDGRRVIQCTHETCPPTHYCHIGADSRTTVCCPKKSSPCDQQLMTGVGEGELNRYYYDSVDDECKTFTYQGIGGNENNFLTKELCQITCPGYQGYCPHGKPLVLNQTLVGCGIDTTCPLGNVCHVSKRDSKSVCCPDPSVFCLSSADSGQCSKQQTRYAYDKQSGICKKFNFGGCQGNLNNFETLEKCTEICCDKEELCLLSIDRGACDGRQTRYAFNRQTSQCVSFEYTGCGGNLNNFATLADCMDTCGNVGFRR